MSSTRVAAALRLAKRVLWPCERMNRTWLAAANRCSLPLIVPWCPPTNGKGGLNEHADFVMQTDELVATANPSSVIICV